MRTLLSLLTVLLCARLSAFAQEAALPNGMRVLLQARPNTRLLAIEIWVRAGSREEQSGEEGAAHFLEHILFKGTKSLKVGELDEEIEKRGGIWSAGTGADYARYHTTLPADQIAPALKLLSDAMQNATLPPEEIERERNVILDELGKHESQPQNILLDQFYRNYAPLPYQNSPGGTPASILKLTRETLLRFYRKHYTPQNCTLVLVGNIIEKEALKAAEDAFGDWKATRKQELYRDPPAPLQNVRIRDVVGVGLENGIILGALLPPASQEPQTTHALLLAEVLQVRLNRRVAPENEPEVLYTPRRGSNFLLVRAKSYKETDTAPLVRLQALLLDQINLLYSQPPTRTEIEEARGRLALKESLAQETLSGMAYALGYPAITEAKSLLKETRVLPTDLQKFAQDYLQRDQILVLRLFVNGKDRP